MTDDAHPAENGLLPCWRGCPTNVADGVRRHQWPCDYHGQVESVRAAVVIDITGGPLSPAERAIHADPTADYYDPTPIPPAATDAERCPHYGGPLNECSICTGVDG